MADGGVGGLIRYIKLLLNPDARAALEKEMQEALDKGTDPKKSKKNLTATERAIESLTERAKKLGTTLLAAFALNKLLAFGKAAVTEALQAREAWTRLDTALRGVGRTTEGTRGQIDELVKTMDGLGVEDEKVATSFAMLLETTDNYERSVRGVQVAVDLAAKRQIDLETATMLVGRAANGSTEMLGRYGIEVKKGADGLKALEDFTRGAAAAQDAGVLASKRAANAWGDLKESIGEALLKAGGGTSVIDTLVAVMKALRDEVDAHPEGIRFLGETMVWMARAAGTVILSFFSGLAKALQLATDGYILLAKAHRAISGEEGAKANTVLIDQLEARSKALNDSADALDRMARLLAGQEGTGIAPSPTRGGVKPSIGKEGDSGAGSEEARERAMERFDIAMRMSKVRELEGQGQAELIDIERELIAQLRAGNLDRKDRVEIEEKLVAINAELTSGQDKRIEQADRLIAAGFRQYEGVGILLELERELAEQLRDTSLLENERLLLEERLATVRSILAELDAGDMLGNSFKEFFRTTFDGTTKTIAGFKQMVTEAGFLSNVVKALAKGQGKAVLEELSIMAKGKALENIALAIEEFARGLANSGNPLKATIAAGHFAAAKTHTLAAAKWGLVGGITGELAHAAGGGGSSGGGPSSGSGSGLGADAAADARPAGPIVHIVVDMFDKSKGGHVAAFHEMQGEVRELYGDEVTVSYKPPGGSA